MTELTNQKVLVTGGAGFVGSNIVRLLVEGGAFVTILDNLYTGREDLVHEDKRVKFVRGDVRDRDLIDALVSEHLYIIHAAAKNIIVSTKNPQDDYETNIGGTLNILLASRRHGIKKLVYTSSTSVYGNPTQIPIVEDSSFYPLSPYSVSKLAGENYCVAFYESYGLPTAVIRYSNVYGINQKADNPYCGVVAKFFDAALKGENIKIHGDGEQTRDFTFVADAASAAVEALLNPKSVGYVFNIGTGIETSINVLASKIIEITGSHSSVEYLDKRDIDNIRRRVVSIELVRRVLRWVPQYNLTRGLKETYEWICEKKAVR